MGKTPADTSTIKIPGGTATFYTEADLPPRREAAVELLSFQLNMRKLAAMRSAASIVVNGEIADTNAALDGPDVTMTEEEAKVLQLVGLTTTWAYLKSWTLKVSHQEGETQVSEPRPLPATPDDMLDLPRGIYDALMDYGTKISAGKLEESFTLEGIDDETSPTTA